MEEHSAQLGVPYRLRLRGSMGCFSSRTRPASPELPANNDLYEIIHYIKHMQHLKQARRLGSPVLAAAAKQRPSRNQHGPRPASWKALGHLRELDRFLSARQLPN